MANNSSDNNQRLLEAKAGLNNAVNNLEKVILNKINQAKLSNADNHQGSLDNNSQNIIQKLNDEIKSLQKEFEKTNSDNLGLKVKNSELVKEVDDLKLESDKIINSVKFDLEKIKLIIN